MKNWLIKISKAKRFSYTISSIYLLILSICSYILNDNSVFSMFIKKLHNVCVSTLKSKISGSLSFLNNPYNVYFTYIRSIKQCFNSFVMASPSSEVQRCLMMLSKFYEIKFI